MRILLIKQTSLGDVVHATAAIRSVRLAYRQAHITVLTSTTAADILAGCPDIDELLTFDRYRVKSDWWRHPLWTLGHVYQVMRTVRQRPVDIAIDLQGSWKTIMFLWAAKTGKRFAKGRWWFAQSFHKPALHAIDEMERVLRLSGIEPTQHQPVLSLNQNDRQRINDLIDDLPIAGRKLAVFCPITRWPTKNWPLANFKLLSERIKNEFFVIFTGGSQDQVSIESHLASSDSSDHKSLAGAINLSEFFALISRADLVVTGDSLPMHAASAFDRPLLAFFGPTDEALVGPRNQNAKVLRADVNCTRCYRRDDCPKNCVNQISVDQAVSAIEKLIAGTDE